MENSKYSEVNKNITIEDFRNRFADRPHRIQGSRGEFAVIVPLVELGDGLASGQSAGGSSALNTAGIGNGVHILYELRSPKIDRQPGEVCFPGGEIEPGETPMEAAIRETWEEIGIATEDIDIIAELDTFHPESGIVIYPFLAEIKREALDRLKLNEDEVAECFLVPLSFFDKEPYTYEYSMHHELGEEFDYARVGLKSKEYKWRPIRSKLISWEFEGRFIWGYTAVMTQWTLETFRKDR